MPTPRGPHTTRLDVERMVEHLTSRERKSPLELSTAELRVLAWYGCCRHLGFPSPEPTCTTRLLAAVERLDIARLVQSVETNAMPTVLDARRRRESMERDAAALCARAPELAAKLRAGINASLVAFDVLEEADRLLAIARETFEAASADVRALALEVIPSSSDKPLGRAPAESEAA